MSNPYRHYQDTSIKTASREKILLMLYEGAIKFVKQAIVATREKKIAQKGRYISKATAILSELMATLDFKVGGKLANDLEGLYVFMIDKLIEGNIKNEVEPLERVEKILSTLHVAWKDVVENPRKDGVPSEQLQPEEYKKFLEGKELGENNPPKEKQQDENTKKHEPGKEPKLNTRA